MEVSYSSLNWERKIQTDIFIVSNRVLCLAVCAGGEIYTNYSSHVRISVSCFCFDRKWRKYWREERGVWRDWGLPWLMLDNSSLPTVYPLGEYSNYLMVSVEKLKRLPQEELISGRFFLNTVQLDFLLDVSMWPQLTLEVHTDCGDCKAMRNIQITSTLCFNKIIHR